MHTSDMPIQGRQIGGAICCENKEIDMHRMNPHDHSFSDLPADASGISAGRGLQVGGRGRLS